MGFLLILIAILGILLTIIFIPLTLIWNYTTFGWNEGNKRNSKYLGRLALSIDQDGNVFLKEVLNRWTIKKGSRGKYYYGDEDDTISYVKGMNFYKLNSNRFGRFIGKGLDLAEKDHMEKAIVSKFKRDLEALKRLKDAEIINIDIPIVSNELAFISYVENVTNTER